MKIIYSLPPTLLLCLLIFSSEVRAGGDSFSARVRGMSYLSADHFSLKLELITVPININTELIGQVITIDLEYDPAWESIFGHKKNGATEERFRQAISTLLSALADQKTREFLNIGNGIQPTKEVRSFRVTSLLPLNDSVAFN